MSLVTKASRGIVVDFTEYRWTIRPRPTYAQAAEHRHLKFAVELGDGVGTTLLVTANGARPDNWVFDRVTVITPAVVERAIRKALNLGWRPAESGSVFTLAV